jgi:hypothetical protein
MRRVKRRRTDTRGKRKSKVKGRNRRKNKCRK